MVRIICCPRRRPLLLWLEKNLGGCGCRRVVCPLGVRLPLANGHPPGKQILGVRGLHATPPTPWGGCMHPPLPLGGSSRDLQLQTALRCCGSHTFLKITVVGGMGFPPEHVYPQCPPPCIHVTGHCPLLVYMSWGLSPFPGAGLGRFEIMPLTGKQDIWGKHFPAGTPHPQGLQTRPRHRPTASDNFQVKAVDLRRHPLVSWFS